MSSCFPWLERAGGEGGWDAGPGPGRQFFFLSSLFFLLFQASFAAARGSDDVRQGGRRLEWGQSPRCPPCAGTELGSFQKNPHLGTPPDSSGQGAEACAHLPTQLLSHLVKMGKLRQMGLAWRTRGLLTFAHWPLYM